MKPIRVLEVILVTVISVAAFSCKNGNGQDSQSAVTAADPASSGASGQENKANETFTTPFGTVGKKEAIPLSGVWIPCVVDPSGADPLLVEFLSDAKTVCDLLYGDGAWVDLQDSMQNWDKSSPRYQGLVDGDFDVVYAPTSGTALLSFKVSSEFDAAYPNGSIYGFTWDLVRGTRVVASDFLKARSKSSLLEVLGSLYHVRAEGVVSSADGLDEETRSRLLAETFVEEDLDRASGFYVSTEDGEVLLNFYHSAGLPHVIQVFEPDPWFTMKARDAAAYFGQEFIDEYCNTRGLESFFDQSWTDSGARYYFHRTDNGKGSYTVNKEGVDHEGTLQFSGDGSMLLGTATDTTGNEGAVIEGSTWTVKFAGTGTNAFAIVEVTDKSNKTLTKRLGAAEK